ncbi:hypothetical protein DSO57_1010915 [Entomophthora muscae]|uniref:Uncharacterized protein n=2 Tax=Entomophthora muscae TaxID=34485 RepID=A0ACC2U458_9FUNG|nr:hypothetical protein DSO57_1010915 [Entomophthora muscae]
MNLWKESNTLSLCCESYSSLLEVAKKLKRALANLVDLKKSPDKKIFVQRINGLQYKVNMVRTHKLFPHALKPSIFLLKSTLKKDLEVVSEDELKEIKAHILKGLLKAKTYSGVVSLKIKIGKLFFNEFPCCGIVDAQKLDLIFQNAAPESEFYTKLSLIPGDEIRLIDLMVEKEPQPLQVKKKYVFVTVINKMSQFSLFYLIKLSVDQHNAILSKEFSFTESHISEASLLSASSPLDLQVCLATMLMVPDKLLSSWVDSLGYSNNGLVCKNTGQFFVLSVVEADTFEGFYENKKLVFGTKKKWSFEYNPTSKDQLNEINLSKDNAPDSSTFFVELQSEELEIGFISKQSKRLGRLAGWDPDRIVESTLIDELIFSAQRLARDLVPSLAPSMMEALVNNSNL